MPTGPAQASPRSPSLSSLLDASSHLYKRPYPSVGWLVGPSVRHAFVKFGEKWILAESKRFRHRWTRKKEGRGGRRYGEEGGTERNEERGGRRDEESEKKKKMLKN